MKERLLEMWILVCTFMCGVSCRAPEPAAAIKPRVVPVIRHLVRDEPPVPESSKPPEIIVDDADGPQPLTPEEFDELKEWLRKQREAASKPPMSARDRALADDGFWIDEDAFKANMPARGWKQPERPKRRVQAVFLKVNGCPPCAKQDQEFESLRNAGWVQSEADDAHIREAIVDEDDTGGWAAKYGVELFPALILESDGQEVKRWEDFVESKAFAAAFSKAVEDLQPLMMGPNDAVIFAAGEWKITKDKLDLAFKAIAKPGRIAIPNEEIRFQKSGVTFVVPDLITGDNIISGSKRRIVPDKGKQPTGEWGWIAATADAIVVDVAEYTVTVELPGLPDPSIKLLTD